MTRAQQEHSAITLYFMDLDGFKKINDLYGHEVGDLLLLQVAKRLRLSFRETDFIARLGGDEFVALIQHPVQDSYTLAQTDRIYNEFKPFFLINGLKLNCHISLGIANYPIEARHEKTLIKLADERMYQNKKDKEGLLVD